MPFPPQPSLPRRVTPIIIFGAAVRPDGSPSPALRRRVEAALRFGAGRADALYIPTGAKGRFGEAECAVMATQLREPACRPRDPRGADRDGYLLLRPRLPGAASQPRPCRPGLRRDQPLPPAALPAAAAPGRGGGPAGADRRLGQVGLAQRWFWRLREVPAIPYDAALVLWERARGR